MNIFKKPNTHPNSANSWLTTMITRENKKTSDQKITLPQTTGNLVLQTERKNIKKSTNLHVICTRELLKKPVEDKQKIQYVHEELDKIQIMPSNLAF